MNVSESNNILDIFSKMKLAGTKVCLEHTKGIPFCSISHNLDSLWNCLSRVVSEFAPSNLFVDIFKRQRIPSTSNFIQRVHHPSCTRFSTNGKHNIVGRQPFLVIFENLGIGKRRYRSSSESIENEPNLWNFQ